MFEQKRKLFILKLQNIRYYMIKFREGVIIFFSFFIFFQLLFNVYFSFGFVKFRFLVHIVYILLQFYMTLIQQTLKFKYCMHCSPPSSYNLDGNRHRKLSTIHTIVYLFKSLSLCQFYVISNIMCYLNKKKMNKKNEKKNRNRGSEFCQNDSTLATANQ